MGEQGNPTSHATLATASVGTLSIVDVKVVVDLWPSWLHHAVTSAVTASDRQAEVTANYPDGTWARPLLDELEASMVAVVAAAAAVEAFTNLVRTVATTEVQPAPSRPMNSSPSAAGTRRRDHVRIVDALRTQMPISGNLRQRLEHHLKQLFTERVAAVHPDARPVAGAWREDLHANVHPDQARFSAEHVVPLVRTTTELLEELVDLMHHADSNPAVRAAAERSRTRLTDDVLATPSWTRFQNLTAP